MEIGESNLANGRQPKIKITDEVAYWSIKLAKVGYFSGNPVLIRQAPLDIVLQVMEYERFEFQVQYAYREIKNENR